MNRCAQQIVGSARRDSLSLVTFFSRQLDHAQAMLSPLGSGKGVNFFLIYTLAKVDSAGRVMLFPGTTYLPINGTSVKVDGY